MGSQRADRLPTWKVKMVAASHHVTFFLGRRFPSAVPLVYVVGYPKSGTTWACQVIADCMLLPFPRHSLLPLGCAAVVHGHELVRRDYPRGVYSIRDGRDAVISSYFFFLRGVPDTDDPPLPRRIRRYFPRLKNKHDVAGNLVPFIEEEMRRPRFGHHWGGHVRAYYDVAHPRMPMLKYEDMLNDGAEHVAQCISKLTGDEPDVRRAQAALDKYSFARQAKRQPGQEDRDRFLRKGQAGDWRNYFTKEAAEIFDHHCGEMLVRSGYEPDRSWVSRVGESPCEGREEGETVPSTPASAPAVGVIG